MKRKRGFSLLEILMVVTLMGLVAVLGVVNTRRGASGQQTAGVAELVAEELRSARFRAISQSAPVAVVFPSGGGTSGHCQSLYILEGTEKPRVTRSIDYSREYPESHIFVGSWAGCPALSRDDMQLGLQGQQFNFAQWGAPQQDDYTVMFTPSGAVKTNGLPHFNNEYHLVVCSGLTTSTAAVPGGSLPTTLKYFQLDSVAQPNTISLGPSGFVTLQSGLLSSSIPVSNQPVASSGEAKLNLPPAPGPNLNPVVKSARMESDPAAPYRIDAGTQASLVVEATDPDGDPLYINFTTTPANQGKYSASAATRMEWVPNPSGSGFYRANWVWSPPAGMTVGTTIKLDYEVTDGKGGSATGSMGTGLSSGSNGKIAFVRSDSLHQEIALCEIDGSGVKVLTALGDKYNHTAAVFSPDGKQLVLTGYSGDARTKTLFACNTDGTNLRQVYIPKDPLSCHGLCWSGDGTKIVTTDRTGIVWIDAKTLETREISQPGDDYVCCSKVEVGGQYRVMFVRNSKVYSANLDDGSDLQLVLSKPGTYIGDAQWSPDCTKVAYSAHPNGNPYQVLVRDLASGTDTLINTEPNRNAYCDRVQFSPDGLFVSYMEWNDHFNLMVNSSNGKNPDTGEDGVAKLVAANCQDFTAGVWSPDSDALIFGDWEAKGMRIFPLKSSAKARVIKFKGKFYYMDPSWAPD